MGTVTEDFTQDYTYSDIVALGKEADNAYRYVSKEYIERIAEILKASRLTKICVERKGRIVWTNEPTSSELKNYGHLIAGMYKLNNDLTSDSAIMQMESFYRPADDWSTSATFTATRKELVTDDGSVTYEKAAEVWELPRHLKVASKAALFYLLYTRTMRGDKKSQDELDFYIAELAPIISRYLDMAAAGELRHMLREQYVWRDGVAPKDVEEQAWQEKHVKKTAAGHLQLNAANTIANKVMATDNRTLAWIHWRAIRKESPIGALNWCIMQHCLSQRGGFGGALWANCANLVRKRELGQVSDIFFVDQAFSLQHNGGAIFNKLWNVEQLQQVLDFAFRGEVEKLPKYLEKEDLIRWRKVSGFVSALDMEHQDKHLTSPVKALDKFEKSTVLGVDAQAVLTAISK